MICSLLINMNGNSLYGEDMSLLSTTMNRAADLTLSESFFARNIGSRVLNTMVCPPLEALEILKNGIKLPVQAVAFAVKIPAKVLNLAINSKTLREFDEQLSGPLDIIITALKIVGYTIGALSTVFLGTLFPMANFRLHKTFGLVKDEKLEAELAAKELEAKRKKEAYERILEEQLKKVTDALRMKIMESVPPPAEPIADEEASVEEVESTEEASTADIVPFETAADSESTLPEAQDPLIEEQQVAHGE